MTPQDLRKFLRLEERIYERAKEYVKLKLEIFPEEFKFGDLSRWTIDEVMVENNSISIVIEETWNYGGYEKHYINVTFKEFASLPLFRKNLQQRKKEYLEWKVQQETEKLEKQRERELETLNRLKQKYENDSKSN